MKKRTEPAGGRDLIDPMTGERLRRINLLGREFVLPRSRFVRIVIGFLLILGGCLGFLPVLGFWMIPLGLVILSYEFAMVRRWRRRSEVWWAERRGRRRRPRNNGASSAGAADAPSAKPEESGLTAKRASPKEAP